MERYTSQGSALASTPASLAAKAMENSSGRVIEEDTEQPTLHMLKARAADVYTYEAHGEASQEWEISRYNIRKLSQLKY